MSNGNGEAELTDHERERLSDAWIEQAMSNEALRDADLEEVGWNRYRVLINALKDGDNDDLAKDVKLLVRFASATHQYLRREKELDYVLAAFKDLPLGPKGIHF